MKEARPATVLDICIGTVTLTRPLYDDGVTVFGVDFSNAMLARARESMPEARLSAADISRDLPRAITERSFDAVLSA